MNYDTICMGCMQEIGEAQTCPHCGFSKDAIQLAPKLPFKTVLGGRYLVGKALSSGGDGVTYIVFDCERRVPVTVREFLPEQHILRAADQIGVRVKRGSELLFRDNLNAFLELYRKLARARSLHAVVPVLDILEENGTGYAVSEFLETISLRDFLLKSKTGTLSFEQTKTLLMPVVSTMSQLHEMGIFHGAISPTTLRLGRDGKIRITDFMIPDARVMGSALDAELMPGYAAIEQYSHRQEIGAWTDVYAFAAVTYRMLVGSTPPEALERVTNDKLLIPAKLVEELPAYAVSAIQNALAIDATERTASIDAYRDELSGSPKLIEQSKEAAVDMARAQTSQEEEELRKRKEKMRKEILRKEEQTKILLISFAIVLALGLIGLGVWLFMTREPNENPETPIPTEQVDAQKEMIEVPSFKDQSYSRIASDEVLNSRFHFVVTYEYSKDVAEGFILSQGVQPGQEVPKGSDMPIVVSKGTEMVLLPDVSGMTYDKAVETLVSAGFTCEKVEKENDGTHTVDIVISTTPQKDKEYEKGKTVYIQVWGEPPTEPPTNIGTFLPSIFE